ncbi:MAG: alpha/beta fold hydrolase [Mycobacterium sp.]
MHSCSCTAGSSAPIRSGIRCHSPFAYNAHVAGLAQFRVIAPDERGTGRTSHSGGSISVGLLADDVAALIGALGLARPAVAGFSAGGLTATIFGIRHPGLARAIVNNAGYDCLNPRADSFAMMRQMLGGSPEAIAAEPGRRHRILPLPTRHGIAVRVDEGRPGRRRRTWLLAGLPHHGIRARHSMAGLLIRRSCSDRRSTLVLVGDRDHFCTVEEGVTTYRHLRKGQLAVVPNTGHTITPTKIVLLQAFLADSVTWT